MRRTLDVLAWTLFLGGGAFLLVSCAQLDKFVTPDPVTGVAPIDDVGKTIVQVGEGLGLSPWAQLGAGALSILGAAYLIWRRFQKARAK